MPTFSIPLSGLTTESTALSAIANNLANLNTTGYKDSVVQFRDLFYQSIGTSGSGDPIQLGAGAGVAATSSLFTQGNVNPTGVATNVAISGSGFFVTQNNGVTTYTRAGDFSVDKNAFLVTDDGQQVLGFPSVNGAITTGQGLKPLQLGTGQISPPNPTGNVQINTNLDATAAVGDTFSTPITIFDSLGASHVLTFTFTKAAANDWNYRISIPPSELNPVLVGGVPTPQTGILATGSLGFDGNGVLTATAAGTAGAPAFAGTGNGTMTGVTAGGASAAQTVTMTAIDPTHFSVVGSVSGPLGTATVGTPFTSGQINFTINAGGTAFVAGDAFTVATTAGALGNVTAIPVNGFADGAANTPFNWNVLNGTVPVISQVAAASSTSSTQQDGAGSGSLESFNIGSDGLISGSFSNGKTAILGQLALATFPNEQGLLRTGRNGFAETLASGQAVVGAPGTGGRGTLSGGALELSNVDIASEFAAMIVAQRGFQANARVVTTFDEVTQDTINLKR